MTQQEVADFLAQFDRAREDFEAWPKWMQEAAIKRAATFPRLTGAQPAPAAPSDGKWVPLEPTEAMVSAALNCQDADPEDGPPADVYCQWRAMLDAAPAAQPADSAMEVLIELVAIDDLKKSHAQASFHASKFHSDENYAVVDKLAKEIARRSIAAWIRARTLTAASKGKTHE